MSKFRIFKLRPHSHRLRPDVPTQTRQPQTRHAQPEQPQTRHAQPEAGHSSSDRTVTDLLKDRSITAKTTIFTAPDQPLTRHSSSDRMSKFRIFKFRQHRPRRDVQVQTRLHQILHMTALPGCSDRTCHHRPDTISHRPPERQFKTAQNKHIYSSRPASGQTFNLRASIRIPIQKPQTSQSQTQAAQPGSAQMETLVTDRLGPDIPDQTYQSHAGCASPV